MLCRPLNGGILSSKKDRSHVRQQVLQEPLHLLRNVYILLSATTHLVYTILYETESGSVSMLDIDEINLAFNDTCVEIPSSGTEVKYLPFSRIYRIIRDDTTQNTENEKLPTS